MSKLQARKIIAEYLIIDDGIIDLYKSVLSINNRLKKENKSKKGEIWVDILGYRGLYQLSNLRRIKSVKKYSVINETITIRPEKILSPYLINGYFRIKLTKNGIAKSFTIHRLVAIHFIKKRKGKLSVNYINGIKCDNRIENLEWCTQKENMRHAFKLGLIKSSEKSIRGLVKRNKLRSGAKHYMARRVLNTETGVYYATVRQAAKETNNKLSALYEKLLGKYKNDTSLVYA